MICLRMPSCLVSTRPMNEPSSLVSTFFYNTFKSQLPLPWFLHKVDSRTQNEDCPTVYGYVIPFLNTICWNRSNAKPLTYKTGRKYSQLRYHGQIMLSCKITGLQDLSSQIWKCPKCGLFLESSCLENSHLYAETQWWYKQCQWTNRRSGLQGEEWSALWGRE